MRSMSPMDLGASPTNPALSATLRPIGYARLAPRGIVLFVL